MRLSRVTERSFINPIFTRCPDAAYELADSAVELFASLSLFGYECLVSFPGAVLLGRELLEVGPEDFLVRHEFDVALGSCSRRSSVVVACDSGLFDAFECVRAARFY